MGAFHNQIRENETFESLMELYRHSIAKNRKMMEMLCSLPEIIKITATSHLRTTIAVWQEETLAKLEDK